MQLFSERRRNERYEFILAVLLVLYDVFYNFFKELI
jgi:hypothetical protein